MTISKFTAIPAAGLLLVATTFAASAAQNDGVLPDHKQTPGVTNPAVTQANIATTVCKVGWTKTIRPTVNYTNNLKLAQLAAGYTYLGSTKPADYEEDHLISLQLGGDPKAVGNLWPQPYKSIHGAREKDALETKLKKMVCAKTITLKEAQALIAGDWYAAKLKYAAKDAATADTDD